MHYVVGKVDVYTRITLLACRPAKGGRGTEDDAIALPGVWAEFDVNGTPDSKGGIVADAFPDLDAAQEVATAVLEPTMLVASGGGLHGYYLLDRMLPLTCDQDREQATALVRGFHARLAREAEDRFGVRKFDSVFDLARVFRPPGSLNGKNGTQRPVQLLDDGDQRYTLAEIRAEVVSVEVPASAAGQSSGPARTVEQLCATFSRLAAIAQREGKAPKDPSPSGWDHWLACEAVRSGLTDAEIAAMVGYARRGDPKGTREDYIKRTVRKARGTVDADAADPAKRISDRWNLGDDPVVSGRTIGDVASGSAIVYLDRRSGRRLRFPRLGDLFQAAAHTRIASTVTRSRFAPLTNAEAVEIAQLVINLCGGEDLDPTEEARQWVTEFIGQAGAVVDALDADGTAKNRWDVVSEFKRAEDGLPRAGNAANRAAVISKGPEWWLPAGALKDYSGSRMSWGQFTSCMSEIGWRHVEPDVREPTNRAGKPNAPRVHRKFYVGED